MIHGARESCVKQARSPAPELTGSQAREDVPPSPGCVLAAVTLDGGA